MCIIVCISRYVPSRDARDTALRSPRRLRVYLWYHDVPQVLAGAAVGTVLALVWFFVASPLIRIVYRRMRHHPLMRFLLIHDASHIPHLLEFEYDAVSAAAPPSPKSKSS